MEDEVEKPYTLSPLGARGASLEDSYRHVLNLQSKRPVTSKPHKGRAYPSSVPSNDEYAASMYHLSQLEPVYHDLENDRSTTSGNTRTTRSSTRRDNDYAPLQKPSTDSSNGNASLRSCWPAGSPNLVHTSSQLEGLTGNGKSKAPKPHRVFSSPRKPLILKDAPKKSIEDVTPILTGADVFETSSVVTGMSQQEVLRRKARAVHQTKKKKKIVTQPRSLKKSKATDRILNLPLSLLGGGKKPPVNKHFAEINITKSALESKETPGTLKARATDAISPQPYSIDPKVDSRFSGDDSFPILSMHPIQSLVEEKSEGAVNDSRIVRFSKDESHTHVFNDSSDRPFDEDEVTSPVAYASPPPGPPEAATAPSPQSSNRSFQSLNSSSSGGLKSILRPARFSPTKQSPDTTNEGGDEVVNTSISKSPPRGSSGFVDDGVELSPIVRENRISADGGTSGVTFHESIQEASSLYPDPSLEAPTEFSDPTVDASGECNTEEDSIMSNVGFIQNVASIVIQTGFRRCQARQFVKSLRENAEATSSSHLRNQLFPSPPRQQSSLDHSLEVRRCFGLAEANASAYSDPIPDTVPLKVYPPPSRKTRKLKKFDPFEERLFTLAAIQIQSLFRGFWVRDCLNVDNYCAAVVQRAFRSHCCRMEYRFQIYRIVIVQAVWRRQLARREASFRLGCILLIQSVARHFLRRHGHTQPVRSRSVRTERRLEAAQLPSRTRGVLRRQGSKEDESAILIQKNWRSFYYETNYLKTLLDVLLAQTAVRRWFAVRKVKRMKVAQQRLKRRHRYVAAASRRRATARVAPNTVVAMSSSVPSSPGARAAAAVKSQPAVVTPRGFKVVSNANNSGGSVAGSTSDVSDDGRTPQSRVYGHGKNGSRPSMELKAVNSRPPLPSSATKVAVVTPKPWPPKSSSRYPEDYGGSSTGSTSALTEDEIQIESATSPPANAPCLIEEDSPGGAKEILSLWRERDKKNSAGKRFCEGRT